MTVLAPNRAAEEMAISEYIAAHGVTKLPPAFAVSSKQGALSEREALAIIGAFEVQADASVREIINYLRHNGCDAWHNGKAFKFAGRLCSRGEFYRAANELRRAAGLCPYRVPQALDGAG